MPIDDGRNDTEDAAQRPRPVADDKTAVETLEQQAQRLGVLDPLEIEPAHIFALDEWLALSEQGGGRRVEGST